jgi:hypothetical protein
MQTINITQVCYSWLRTDEWLACAFDGTEMIAYGVGSTVESAYADCLSNLETIEE